jgi:hypothetical protein
MLAAVIGGTASRIGVGKFTNGAMTGAFSWLLNHELHRAQSGYADDATPAKTEPISPEIEPLLDPLYDAAAHASAEVEGYAFGLGRLLPARLRGTLFHLAFARRLDAPEYRVMGYSAEVSYLEGRVVPSGTPGSVRADAIHGSRGSPTFAVDIKTGIKGVTFGDAIKYSVHLPPGTPLFQIRVIRAR